MDITEAIRNRRSIRGFKPDPVPRAILEEIFEMCRWAPSYRDMQSWEFIVVEGRIMEALVARIGDMVRTNTSISPEIPAIDLPEPYIARATILRDMLDRQQFPPGTENLKEKRFNYNIKSGCFNYAPQAILMCAEKSTYPWSLCEAGIMAQTISLAALTYGLGTCIMAKPTYWPEVIRETIRIPSSKNILMAIAIGYPDPDALINSVERVREKPESFISWAGTTQ